MCYSKSIFLLYIFLIWEIAPFHYKSSWCILYHSSYRSSISKCECQNNKLIKFFTIKSKFAEKCHQRWQPYLIHSIDSCHCTSLKVIIKGKLTSTAVFFWKVLWGRAQDLCCSLVSIFHILLLDIIFSACLPCLLTTSLFSLSPLHICH